MAKHETHSIHIKWIRAHRPHQTRHPVGRRRSASCVARGTRFTRTCARSSRAGSAAHAGLSRPPARRTCGIETLRMRAGALGYIHGAPRCEGRCRGRTRVLNQLLPPCHSLARAFAPNASAPLISRQSAAQVRKQTSHRCKSILRPGGKDRAGGIKRARLASQPLNNILPFAARADIFKSSARPRHDSQLSFASSKRVPLDKLFHR